MSTETRTPSENEKIMVADFENAARTAIRDLEDLVRKLNATVEAGLPRVAQGQRASYTEMSSDITRDVLQTVNNLGLHAIAHTAFKADEVRLSGI